MTLLEGLQIEYTHLEGDSFTSAMVLSDFHAQPFGYLNGGATIAYGEALAGMMSNALLPDGYIAVGQSVNAQHLRPTECRGKLYARGRLLKGGKRSHVWDIDMLDEEDNLIAHITVVNAIVPNPLA